MSTINVGKVNTTTGVQLPSYTTENLPTTGISPGFIAYDSTVNGVKLWNGSAWVGISSQGFSATGGVETEVGNYKVHTFTTNGTFNVSSSGYVEVLVVAGGGGGATWYAGGGGGGGVVYASKLQVNAGSYDVVVGAGGAGRIVGTIPSYPVLDSYGRRGGDSRFGSVLIAKGGGGGPGYGADASWSPGDGYPQVSGGCGAGGRHSNNGAHGTSIQATLGSKTSDAQAFGNDGGFQGTNGGGGGGAGGRGQSGAGRGDGGPGISFNMNGTATFYAAGGGGGNASGSFGGKGGGGNGTGSAQPGDATGFGCGGGSNVDSTSVRGGNGSSGIVIIRYPKKNLTVQSFTSVGTTNWQVPAGITSVSALVVGGGGGGSGTSGSGSGPRGGGGAGGVVWNPNVAVTPGSSVTVTVGDGGAGGAAGGENSGSNGSQSVFGSIIAYGGGGGRHYGAALSSGGASGGGRAFVGYAAAREPGIDHQGYDGGLDDGNSAGGGGGAGQQGRDGTYNGTVEFGGGGGTGKITALSGSPAYYGGGGGAGTWPANQANTNGIGIGGTGGGGNGGGGGIIAPTAGAPNTGGGGGGGGSGTAGAAGGSGIVIIAY